MVSASVSVSAEIKCSLSVSVSVQVAWDSFGFGRNWKKWFRSVSTEVSGWFMPKITKLWLNMSKLCLEYCGLFFSRTRCILRFIDHKRRVFSGCRRLRRRQWREERGQKPLEGGVECSHWFHYGHVELTRQDAQLPQRDSASAMRVFLGSLTARALHWTPHLLYSM